MAHDLKTYEVTYILTIYAHNEDEAEELALENVGFIAPDILEVENGDEPDVCEDEACFLNAPEDDDDG